MCVGVGVGGWEVVSLSRNYAHSAEKMLHLPNKNYFILLDRNIQGNRFARKQYSFIMKKKIKLKIEAQNCSFRIFFEDNQPRSIATSLKLLFPHMSKKLVIEARVFQLNQIK